MLLNLVILVSFQTSNITDALSSKKIIAKSIEFHEPDNNGQELRAHLNFMEKRPYGETRHTSVEIDTKRGNFYSIKVIKEMRGQRHIRADSCFYNVVEYEELTDKEVEENELFKTRSSYT